MSFKSAIQRKLIASAIIYLVKDANKKNLVQEIVKRIEEISQREIGSYSDKTQIAVVQDILIPVAREILCNTTEGAIAYRAIVALEYQKVSNSLKDLRGV